MNHSRPFLTTTSFLYFTSHSYASRFSIFLLWSLLVLLPACDFFGERSASDEIPVARVKNNYLYQSDLEGLAGASLAPADSADLVNHHVESWIRRNLLLDQAATLLPSEAEEEVQQKVDDYRASLIIFLVEQELLKQQLDSIISDKEIEDYYQQYQESFRIDDHMLKSRFIISSGDTSQLESAKKWLSSNPSQHKSELQDYCAKFAHNYSLEPKWYFLKNFTAKIPIPSSRPDKLLSSQTFYEFKDNNYNYLITIEGYALKGSVAPLEYKKEDIAKVIVNKRRLELLKKIKDQIYEQAMEKGSFEIF